MYRCVFLATLLVTSAAANAKSVHVRDIGGWSIMRDDSEDKCTMHTTYTDGEIFYLTYNARYQNYMVLMHNERWKSLVDGANYNVAIEMQGLNGKWEDDEALAVNSQDAGPALLIGGFDSDFGPEIMTVSGVTVYADGTVLSRLSMKGSKEAVLAIVRCATDLLNNSKSDPFKDAKPTKVPEKPYSKRTI